MKKLFNIFLVVIMALTIVIMLDNVVFASDLTQIAQQTQIGESLKTEAAPVGNRVIKVMKIIGMIAAVMVLMLVGIKFMVGSVEEKAEYKQTAIIYIVGAILLFATPQLVDFIYNLMNG